MYMRGISEVYGGYTGNKFIIETSGTLHPQFESTKSQESIIP